MNKNRHLINEITIKYCGVEYHEGTTITVDASRNVLSFIVGVNGNYDCNDFEIDYYDSWLSYKRIRNMVDVIIEPNRDKLRSGTILISNRLNRAIKFELEIRQDTVDYSIYVRESDAGSEVYTNELILDGDKAFSPLTSATDDDKYEKLIDVKTNNGKPFISVTKEYAKPRSAEDGYVKVKYDNGLNLFLVDENTLKITSYGKANLYYSHYYIVTLKNKNSVYDEARIIIKYNTEEDNFSIIDD